jgi:hypothetical protein
MSPQEPEGDAQGSPFPPPFKWGATRPAPKPPQQRPEGPRPEPPVVVAISTQPAAPPADTEFGAPPVSPPWLAPQRSAGHDRQPAPGRQSVALAVLIGVLVLVVVGVVAFVVL